jgi:hypothetical protein
MYNSIVGDNTAPFGADIYGGTIHTEYSLIENTDDADIDDIEGNLLDVAPALSPLADNGGPTRTMMPRSGSPVINAADPEFEAPPTTDQRGSARVVGGRADMGAVEQ